MFRLKAYWIYLFLVAKFAGMVCSSKAEHIIRRGPVSDPHCMSPLTNSKDEFPDSAFSASSVLQNRTEFQPYQARMTEVYGSKEHTSGHAWCPDGPSEDSLREWIQAEFSELVYVRAIYTAGRGDGNVKEFMPNFVLKYQREDGGAWYEHQKRDGSRILKANSDPRNLARATLETTVIAKRIRIYPYSRKASQQVCLRFSLYGCKFPDGVVSYSIPQGGIISRDRSYLPASDDPVTSISENFKDLSYDGQLIGSTNQLTDGLGQLMDNVAYFENVTTPSDMYPAQPGFHFVGWYQPGQTDVQILFKFDRIRKFTWLRLFTYDSIQLRARLISRATISFSLDGVNYGNSIEIPTGRAQLSDFGGSRTNSDQMSSVRLKRSRTATPARQDPRIYTSSNWDGTAVLELDLNNRVGRFVKVTLTTTDSWILLSEVQFNSTIATDIPPQTVGKSAADKEPALLVQGEGATVADSKRELGAKARPIDTPLSANEQAGDSRASVFDGDTTPRDSISPMRDREADKNEFASSSPGLSIIMPFIIAIVILIFALPTIVLIWICSRKRCRRSRSGCHRKVLLADGGRSGPLGGMHHLGDGTNSMTVQEATKLLNSYSTVPSSLRPDGTIVIPTQVCLANGTHASTTNVTHVTSNGLGGLGGATVSPLAYPPPPPAPPPPPGVGVILPCSPSSSSSSQTNGENQAAVPAVVSNIAPSLQPNSFLTATNPDGSNMYSGTEGSCMSPEYASASLFGMTPPPSDLSAGLPAASSENAPASVPRALPPTYAVSFACPIQGLGTAGAGGIYTGPASVPVTAATLRPASRHMTPNPTHRFQPSIAPHTAGLLFLPQSAYKGSRSGDPSGFYQVGSDINDRWIFQPGSNMGSVITNGPKGTWLGDANPTLLPNPVTLMSTTSPGGEGLEMPHPSPHISPQHYFTSQLVFPAMPPAPCSSMAPAFNGSHMEVTYPRGSPVGAAANMNPLVSINEAGSRDGTSSGRLSLYSVCI